MCIPGFTAQAALYDSLRYYATLAGSDPACAQPLRFAMPKGGYHPPDCKETCGPYGSDCMRTCTVDCHPGFPGNSHTFKESRCSDTEGCCGGKCVDILHDPNCGFCGKKCSGSHPTCCAGECVNLKESTRNCGECGRDCRPGSCEAGKCVCPSGHHTCAGICCPSGQDCLNGCCVTNTAKLTMSSDENALLFNGCKNIEDLTVSLRVTEHLVATNGFSLQLNAYSPSSSADLLQYLFQVAGNEIVGSIQYWDSSAACCHQGVCDCTGPVMIMNSSVRSLPSNTLPAGYELKIFLNTDDNERVTSATFTVTDNHGHTDSQEIDIDSDQLHRIRAFEVNVVGPFNDEHSHFSSGAGTITYEVLTGELCVEGGLPERCTNIPFPTAETSNAKYGPIGPACCNSRLSQSLSI